MAPLRHAVHILPSVMIEARNAEQPLDLEIFASLDQRLDTAASDLAWWAQALAQARSVDQPA
jgi:hypothetical protein